MAGKTQGTAKCSCERCLCSESKRSSTSWKMPFIRPPFQNHFFPRLFFFIFIGVFFPLPCQLVTCLKLYKQKALCVVAV